jgi:hypothetical protein
MGRCVCCIPRDLSLILSAHKKSAVATAQTIREVTTALPRSALGKVPRVLLRTDAGGKGSITKGNEGRSRRAHVSNVRVSSRRVWNSSDRENRRASGPRHDAQAWRRTGAPETLQAVSSAEWWNDRDWFWVGAVTGHLAAHVVA